MALQENWWAALVTFERTAESQTILPDRAQGACWMGCLAQDSDDLRRKIAESLSEAGVRLLEIDNEHEVLVHDFAEIDEHLSENVHRLEPGKKVVWGTIHVYLADGKA